MTYSMLLNKKLLASHNLGFCRDVVFDPFNGSGTTCVAAKQSGRVFVGMDLSEEYCAIADERIMKTEPALIPEVETSSS